MNNKKRETLTKAYNLLQTALDLVSSVQDKELDDLDNLPENLQCSERAENMETAIDKLEDAVSNIEAAQESIEDAKE